MSGREEMIVENMPLVAFVVNRLSTDRVRTLGLDREDAMGFGLEGLIQAVDGYDAERGASFASFAVRRIKGSILDAVRRDDPLPRSLRRSTRELEKAGQELASQLGRWPSEKEIAMRLGITPDAVRQTKQHATARLISLETALQGGEGDEPGQRWDPVDPDERNDPSVAAEHLASLGLLREAVIRLPERDRKLLKLRYQEARPFHQVGRILGLSESRVCQLHKRILRQLRTYLLEVTREAA